MSSPFVGEIRIFGFNFPPTGWALCNGQLLPISQNTALFSLLGTNYGGDGKSTFALPNLQGAAPMSAGDGTNGLSLRQLGEIAGESTVTLLQSEMPAHTHSVTGSARPANENDPVNFYFGSVANLYSAAASPAVNMALQMIGPYGGDNPHNNLMPYLTLSMCIAMQGVYPPRQ